MSQFTRYLNIQKMMMASEFRKRLAEYSLKNSANTLWK